MFYSYLEYINICDLDWVDSNYCTNINFNLKCLKPRKTFEKIIHFTTIVDDVILVTNTESN